MFFQMLTQHARGFEEARASVEQSSGRVRKEVGFLVLHFSRKSILSETDKLAQREGKNRVRVQFIPLTPEEELSPVETRWALFPRRSFWKLDC